MEMGSDIAQRNLQRAAELVTSFKQVAADQTSAQRRRFDLREVCDEIVLTLRPVLKQCDAQVVMSVPEGLAAGQLPRCAVAGADQLGDECHHARL